jgi:DNA-binding winged helix-turn-helix (wHTH) protein/tetratricopeptide (TPR) repeat protein
VGFDVIPPEYSEEQLRRDGFVAGDWSVTPSRNLLSRGREEARVEPRVMDVLVYLAAHAQQVVSKDELVAHVWNGRHVTDDVLTVTIYALRKALGDRARQPQYIETVARRGYRWMAPVSPRLAPGPVGRPRHQAPARRPPRLSWLTAAALAAVMLVAGGAVWITMPIRHSRRIAVAGAREACVKGRYFLDRRSVQTWQQAREQFERAIALDPDDPAAHAGLADTYSAMSDFGMAPAADMRPRAMQEARRALELDASSAEGHAALGRSQFLFDWDFAGAERSLADAIALDPDYMPAYQTLAWLESARGRSAQAVASARRARELDPVTTSRYTELAWVLVLGGRHTEALREIDRALELDPRSFQTLVMKGWAYEQARQPDAAFAAYRDALRLAGAPSEALEHVDAVYRAEGLPGYYRNWLNRAGAMPMSETWRAQLYVRVGDRDRALESLEHAYEKREGALAWVNVEPSFATLRSEARFQRIAASVGRSN